MCLKVGFKLGKIILFDLMQVFFYGMHKSIIVFVILYLYITFNILITFWFMKFCRLYDAIRVNGINFNKLIYSTVQSCTTLTKYKKKTCKLCDVSFLPRIKYLYRSEIHRSFSKQTVQSIKKKHKQLSIPKTIIKNGLQGNFIFSTINYDTPTLDGAMPTKRRGTALMSQGVQGIPVSDTLNVDKKT